MIASYVSRLAWSFLVIGVSCASLMFFLVPIVHLFPLYLQGWLGYSLFVASVVGFSVGVGYFLIEEDGEEVFVV